jgi:hypothetical protein
MIETVVEVASLLFDESLYPRQSVNEQTIADYAEAMRAGAKFPPIVADKKGRRIVDGWHRGKASQRAFGVTATVEVDFRSYPNEQAIVLDAVRLNAVHGQRFSHYDLRHCVILCERVHISAEKIAGALGLTLDKFKRISENEVHRDEEGNPICAGKQPSMHLIEQGKPITDRQNSALAGMLGNGQTFTINQVSRLIEGRLLNKSDERIMAALEKLYGLLRGIFEKKENAA